MNMNVHFWNICVGVCLDCRFAFQYNPSLQPRALVVFGCISKRVSHGQIKQIIRILSKASPLLSIDRVRHNTPSNLTTTHEHDLFHSIKENTGKHPVFSHHASVVRIDKNPIASILFAQSVTLCPDWLVYAVPLSDR